MALLNVSVVIDEAPKTIRKFFCFGDGPPHRSHFETRNAISVETVSSRNNRFRVFLFRGRSEILAATTSSVVLTTRSSSSSSSTSLSRRQSQTQSKVGSTENVKNQKSKNFFCRRCPQILPKSTTGPKFLNTCRVRLRFRLGASLDVG